MDVTGIVNVQCAHVFVKSSVDLLFGERYVHLTILQPDVLTHCPQLRFANVDYALAHSLRLRPTSPSIDHVCSYDCMCQYSVHLQSRIKENFPDVAPLIKDMRYAIPALHIQNHKDDCMYKYGTAYLNMVGHFHAETAEHYWPSLNKLAANTKQMNAGHRHDTIIDHHGDWNWKKTTKMGEFGSISSPSIKLILPYNSCDIIQRARESQ